MNHETNNNIINDLPKYYTSEELCERFRFSRRTLYRYIETGVVTPTKLAKKYLFTEENVQQIINHGKQAR